MFERDEDGVGALSDDEESDLCDEEEAECYDNPDPRARFH
jgi:hypothetical protein